MREIAGMHARFLGLLLGMGQQGVDLIDQRLDFERQRLGNPVGALGPHCLDRIAHAAQRRKTVPALQHRHRHQAEPEHRETPDQDRTDADDLVIQFLAAEATAKVQRVSLSGSITVRSTIRSGSASNWSES